MVKCRFIKLRCSLIYASSTNNSVTLIKETLELRPIMKQRIWECCYFEWSNCIFNRWTDDTYGLQNGETVGSVTLTSSGEAN